MAHQASCQQTVAHQVRRKACVCPQARTQTGPGLSCPQRCRLARGWMRRVRQCAQHSSREQQAVAALEQGARLQACLDSIIHSQRPGGLCTAPTAGPPASSSGCTARACWLGTYSKSRQAAVVGCCATSMLSFTANGTPHSGPRCSAGCSSRNLQAGSPVSPSAAGCAGNWVERKSHVLKAFVGVLCSASCGNQVALRAF